ncbi:MAG: hypothetical protein EOO16_07195 [Chitinophagaceae bacterium]|nr:MAG: hypothetical protein EOO16_07195 [Chitinophagaceae bacterium]
MKNLMMGLLLLAVAGAASAQGGSRDAAGVILGGPGRDVYASRDGKDRDRYDRDRKDRDGRYDRRDDDRDRRDRSSADAARERYQRDVDAINRKYNERAERVRYNSRLRGQERRDVLVAIERERQERLRELNDRYYAYNRSSNNSGYYRGY